jgi:hypothetical protein
MRNNFANTIMLGLLLAACAPSQQPATAGQACPLATTRFENVTGFKAALMAGPAGAGPFGKKIRRSESYLHIEIQNTSAKQIAGVRIGTTYYDSVEEIVGEPHLVTQTVKTRPGKTMIVDHPDDEFTNGDKTLVVGWVDKVFFFDGSSWQDDGSHTCGARTRSPR